MRQTAVEFLHSEYKRILGDVLVKPSQAIKMADALEQAKEMEKQQIIEAHGNQTKKSSGISNYTYTLTGEQYYNETFKKK